MQRPVTPVSNYGQSGGTLLLNPTDRDLNANYTIPGFSSQAGDRPAQVARRPAVIRGTPPTYVSGGGASTATFTNMAPATAVKGSADITVTMTGTGFTPSTFILWNGSPETTTYVSATSLTTVVKPSLVSAAVSIPVAIQKPGEVPTAPRTFTFT